MMRISNFVFTDKTERRGCVDVTTGILWWRKTTRRPVFREQYSPLWRWADTGDMCPGYHVENLAAAARNTKEQAK